MTSPLVGFGRNLFCREVGVKEKKRSRPRGAGPAEVGVENVYVEEEGLSLSSEERGKIFRKN
ncbi:MAG: hypothetical protein D6713_03845 [Deltaproteobacteria bacterium]|nr:MAG: hypothetical protein D6713_03845 [Deltaproteobacteria bacterium]